MGMVSVVPDSRVGALLWARCLDPAAAAERLMIQVKAVPKKI